MAKEHFRIIKRFIKIAVACSIIILAIVLGISMKNTKTFENHNMSKWMKISDYQQKTTVEHVVKNFDQKDLIIACVNKIYGLPNSNEMIIRDAISLCYNGIKINENTNYAEK